MSDEMSLPDATVIALDRHSGVTYVSGPAVRHRPDLFRVDCSTVGSKIWAANALRFQDEEAATTYAENLYGRWMLMTGYRVVSADTPESQDVTA